METPKPTIEAQSATRDAPFFWLLVCFVLSGAAGLVYQTAWSQRFAQVFGASELAVATVLAAYMAGLALGAGLVGRWVDRVRRPVRVYAGLELGIALAALALPWGLELANRLQVHLLGGLDAPPDAGGSGSALFHLVAAFVLLLPPTAMMGATLPLLARHAVEREDQLGPRIAWLYTANTLGAAVGALAGAYLLLPSLGLRRTVWVGALLNGVVFLAALALDRARRRQHEAPDSGPVEPRVLARDERAEPDVPDTKTSGTMGGRWILPAMTLSGMVSFTYEVFWTRLLTHHLGASVYAFGAMLATFLVGLSLGSGLVGRWASNRARARLLFAGIQLAIAATFAAAYALLEALPGWLGPDSTEGTLLAIPILLPGAIAIGATFPLAVRILAHDADDAARASARVFAWNTLGAIVGAVVAGFWLLPTLGYAGTLSATMVVSCGLALWATLVTSPRPRVLAVAALLGLLLAVLVRPQPPWRTLTGSPLGPERGTVAHYAVGRSANVLLLDLGHGWRLATNGLPEALIRPHGARVGQQVVARWLTLLPALVRPEGRDLLVIGLGGGVALEEVPRSVERIDVVELEPEVVEANRKLAELRRKDPLADPRVRLVVNDARSALLLADRHYDAIVSQPSHPWTAGASHLFTRELFQLAHDRLSDDGVFLQWIGLTFVDESLLRSLIATLGEVFPHVEVYLPTPQAALFLGSREPLSDPARIARALAAEPELFQAMGLATPDDVLMRRWLDDEARRRFAADAATITDGVNLLQTQAPKVRGGLGQGQALEVLAPFDPWLEPGQASFARAARLAREQQVGRARQIAGNLESDAEREAALALVEMRSGNRRAALLAARRALELAPDADATWEALLTVHRQALVEGRPLSFVDRLAERPEAILAEAWRQAAGEDFESLQRLDAELAQLADPVRAFTREIPLLRARWRVAEGSVARAHEAIALLDGAGLGQPDALLLRGEAAISTGEAELTRAALAELLQGLERGSLPGRTQAEIEALVGRAATLGLVPDPAVGELRRPTPGDARG